MSDRKRDFRRLRKTLRTLITVTQTREQISFLPKVHQPVSGLLFYPGGMVDPKAYAPLVRQLAENSFAVYIVKLPLRSAPLPGQEAHVMDYTRQVMATNGAIQRWLLAGHSRGGAIVSRFVAVDPDLFAALILIGTSHPKKAAFDLSAAKLPVLKIYVTRDGLASVGEIEETSRFLPKTTTWVRIEGGNHSQFGYIGTLFGDQQSTISRPEQQVQTVTAILSMLNGLNSSAMAVDKNI